MTWLNYNHLYYFSIIAREGGVARAAEKLRLGQPTLSTQLKQLEEVIGHPLFERKNRKMVLTEAGKIALQYAEQIFSLGDELVAVIQDRLITNRVHVQIGALDTIAKDIIIDLVRAANKSRSCTVSVFEGKGDELLRDLMAHNLDIVLSNYSPSISVGLVFRQIAKMPVIICGNAAARGLARGFPASLEGANFILPTVHSKLRHDLDYFFKSHNLKINCAAESQDTSLMTSMGAAGLGLVAVARPAVASYLATKDLFEIGNLPGLEEQLWLIMASRRIENPVARDLMKEFTLQ